MNKYYLICTPGCAGILNISVSDNNKSGTVLMEIEAYSFAEANRKICFNLKDMGRTHVMHYVSAERNIKYSVYD